MDESTQQYLELMHKTIKDDHAEVQRRLDVIEQNQRDLQLNIAFKTDIDALHARLSEAKAEFNSKIETEKKRTNDLEKRNAELEGGLKATKFWGCVVGGILMIVEIVVILYK